jgi:hypothetical protein
LILFRWQIFSFLEALLLLLVTSWCSTRWPWLLISLAEIFLWWDFGVVLRFLQIRWDGEWSEWGSGWDAATSGDVSLHSVQNTYLACLPSQASHGCDAYQHLSFICTA